MKCELCGKDFQDGDKLARHRRQHSVGVPEVSEEFGREMDEIVQHFTRDVSRLCLQEGVDDMGLILLTALQHVLALTIPQEEDMLAFAESFEEITRSAVEAGVLKPRT